MRELVIPVGLWAVLIWAMVVYTVQTVISVIWVVLEARRPAETPEALRAGEGDYSC